MLSIVLHFILHEIMPVSSLDLSSPLWKNIDMPLIQPQNTVSYPKLYARRPSMTWDVGLFILNRLVEPVKRRVCCSHGFKERHTTKIMNDNFSGRAINVMFSYVQPPEEVESKLEPYMQGKSETMTTVAL
jgi:hypothetical protein